MKRNDSEEEMVRLFRLRKAGPPRPGLVAVRVTVRPTPGRAGYSKIVYKRLDKPVKEQRALSDVIHEGEDAVPTFEEAGSSYPVLLYVRPEDFAELVSTRNIEQLEIEARAALLLARVDSFGKADELVTDFFNHDGTVLSDYAKRVVDRIRKLVELGLAGVPEDQRLDVAERIAIREAKRYVVRGKILGFRGKEESDFREGETEGEKTSRWERTRREMVKILSHNALRSLGLVSGKPLARLPKRSEEASDSKDWASPYSMASSFANGDLSMIEERVEAGDAKKRGLRSSPTGWRKQADGAFTRILLKKEDGSVIPGGWNALIDELMASRIAVRDEEGELVVKRVPLPQEALGLTSGGKSLWNNGLMSVILRQLHIVSRRSGVGRRTPELFARLLSAGYIGAMHGVVSYNREKVPEGVDPVYGFMNHVAHGVDDALNEEVANIIGANKGESEAILARLSGGSRNRVRIAKAAIMVAKRVLASAGIYRNPTKEETLQYSLSLRANVAKALPAGERISWEDYLSKLADLDTPKTISFDATYEGEEGETVISADRAFGDATLLTDLQAGMPVKTMGTVGEFDVTVYKEIAGPPHLGDLPVEERARAGGLAFAQTVQNIADTVQRKERETVSKYSTSVAAPRIRNPVFYEVVYDPVSNTAVVKTEILGSGVIHPEQIPRLEMAAKTREALFRALARGVPGRKRVFTPEDAERLDMLLFPGLVFLPHQDYNVNEGRLRDIAKELASVTEELESHGANFRRGESAIRSQVKEIGVTEMRARVNDHRRRSGERKAYLQSEKDRLTAEYSKEENAPVLMFPDVAPLASATPGSMAYPSMPLDAYGEIDKERVRHLTVKGVQLPNFKNYPSYAVAYHMTLRKALKDSRYAIATLNSANTPEDHENPLIRNRTKIATILNRASAIKGSADYAESYVYDSVRDEIVPLYEIVTKESFLKELEAVDDIRKYVELAGFMNPKSSMGLGPVKDMAKLREGHTPVFRYGSMGWKKPAIEGTSSGPPRHREGAVGGTLRAERPRRVWEAKQSHLGRVAKIESVSREAPKALRESVAMGAALAEGRARATEIAGGVDDPTVKYRAAGHVIGMIEAALKSDAGQQKLLDMGASEVRRHLVITGAPLESVDSTEPKPTRTYYHPKHGLVAVYTSRKAKGRSRSVHGARGYKGPEYVTSMYKVKESPQPVIRGQANVVVQTINELWDSRPKARPEEVFEPSGKETQEMLDAVLSRPVDRKALPDIEGAQNTPDGSILIPAQTPPLKSYVFPRHESEEEE